VDADIGSNTSQDQVLDAQILQDQLNVGVAESTFRRLEVNAMERIDAKKA
jgi:hypothetical protein